LRNTRPARHAGDENVRFAEISLGRPQFAAEFPEMRFGLNPDTNETIIFLL
jgi:hypothetical protein